MSNRLIALDKKPGVRPIGIGQIWRRAMAKLVLAASSSYAAKAAGYDQLCVGMKSGAEGAIHAATQLWQEHADEPDYGFIQLDARNAFNCMSRFSMLYVARYEWPQAALFAFNCYKHHSSLVIRSSNGSKTTLLSKTGVTQGCPMAMPLYGMGLLPMIGQLKLDFPNLHHIWYADDGNGAGKLRDLLLLFLAIQRIGPSFGYYLNPAKCVIITNQGNRYQADRLFTKYGFDAGNITTGHRFLGGFIGTIPGQQEYLDSKVSHWEAAITRLAAVATIYPQAAYCAYTKSLQMEWQFIQRVMDNNPDSFFMLEKTIQYSLIPALFATDCPPPRDLTCLPRKAAGLGITNPLMTQEHNHHTSQAATDHLASAIIQGTAVRTRFRLQTHNETVQAARRAHQELTASNASTALISYLATQPEHISRIIRRAPTTGQWLSITPTTSSQTLLSPVEFRDGLHLRYGMNPPGLPSQCDGCGVQFTLDHGLNCKKGGLVIQRHNELRDAVASLAASAFQPNAVRSEPAIFPLQQSTSPETPLPPTATATATPATATNTVLHNVPPNQRGDLLVRGLFHHGTDAIIDFKVTHLDSQSYRHRDHASAFKEHERNKNRKYKRACMHFRRDFTPFIASCDGLLGPQAHQLLRRLAAKLANKWSRPYSAICGYVFSRISLALLRSTSQCLRGSRVPASLFSQQVYTFDEAEGVLHLSEH
jgi:hypothetical protein